jgi:hypothetical protein
MKNFKLINLLLIVATSLLLVNCTTDPIPGPDGQDGVDGIDGVNGISGTAECAACHNVAKSEEVHASYLFSGHYNENMDHDVDSDGINDPLSQYGNRGFGGLSCTSCHTSDGYADFAQNGVSGAGGSHPVYPGTQTITCNTCHNTHTSFDFESDGFDFALRIIDPVMLVADNSVTIDYGPDNKTSHTCATCHQPRSTFDGSLKDDGTYGVNSRFGPHYGAQSTLLEGIQGAELAGYEYRSTNGSAAHRAGSSCTQCHMGESTGNNDGLHTKKPTETTCLNCHTDGSPSADFLKEDFDTLENLLLAEGILKLEEDGEISIVSGDYDLIPAAALWNYKMIYYDHSHGVHNPKYAKDLIRNSIDALNGN